MHIWQVNTNKVLIQKVKFPTLDPIKGGYDLSNPKKAKGKPSPRNVRMEDGIILPRYRLPIEAEWNLQHMV